MSKEDFEFAIRITSQMEWGLGKGDFEFFTELEPDGCFILLSGTERIGLATAISFGKIGWFGNLIVDRNRRNKGAGSLLVKHSIEYLRSKNVSMIGLYAYLERIPFYERLGFKNDTEFAVMKGRAFSSPENAGAKKAGKQDLNKIITYDSACFGASRRKTLEPILLDEDNLCYFSSEKWQITGYAVAKVYGGVAELGPLVCRAGDHDLAVRLLESVFNRLEGLEVSMYVLVEEEAICRLLLRKGFNEKFRVARMFLGVPAIGKCICLPESLERG